MKNTETITIEELPTKFNSFIGAIEYYITQAPTKQKPQTIEPVGGCKPAYHEFDPRHPARIWATLSIGFAKLYRDFNSIEQFAFRFWLKMYPPSWGVIEIAKHHGVDGKGLARAKKYSKEKIEDFLILEGLIPMPSHWEPAQRDHSPGRLRKRKMT